MKFRKSMLMGTGVVILAGLILTLLAPKAAHAIVATAVSVVNTSSNPVPVSSIDGPGRIPFVESGLTSACVGSPACLITFSAVPAGHRVVITYFSGTMGFISPPTAINVSLNGSNGAAAFNVPVAIVGARQDFGAPVVYYFDAGQIPQFEALTANGMFEGSTTPTTGDPVRL